jgi:hypothetical protein
VSGRIYGGWDSTGGEAVSGPGRLGKEQEDAEGLFGYAKETWEPNTQYEKAKVFCREIKQMALETGA